MSSQLADPLPVPPLYSLSKSAHDQSLHFDVIKGFMQDLPFKSPCSAQNPDLRSRLSTEIASWDIDVSTSFTELMLHNSCTIAECAYAHTSAEHQYFVALYTAFIFYADDHCGTDPEPIGHFAQRTIEGAPQLDPVLDCFAAHLKNAFDLWPLIAADAIITGTFNAITAMYIEYTTKEMGVQRGATKYPYYLRNKSGVGTPYAHFIFTKSWRGGVDTYLQIIPELDFAINSINLSYHKESLAGESNNYMNLRAAAEGKSPTEVLRTNMDEVLETLRKVDWLMSADAELGATWYKFLQGYVEFHVRITRYRLDELGLRV